jgi:hypothetical protein
MKSLYRTINCDENFYEMKTNATKVLSNGMQCDWMMIEENNTKSLS